MYVCTSCYLLIDRFDSLLVGYLLLCFCVQSGYKKLAMHSQICGAHISFFYPSDFWGESYPSSSDAHLPTPPIYGVPGVAVYGVPGGSVLCKNCVWFSSQLKLGIPSDLNGAFVVSSTYCPSIALLRYICDMWYDIQMFLWRRKLMGLVQYLSVST